MARARAIGVGPQCQEPRIVGQVGQVGLGRDWPNADGSGARLAQRFVALEVWPGRGWPNDLWLRRRGPVADWPNDLWLWHYGSIAGWPNDLWLWHYGSVAGWPNDLWLWNCAAGPPGPTFYGALGQPGQRFMALFVAEGPRPTHFFLRCHTTGPNF
jgi:hypothetical protein